MKRIIPHVMAILFAVFGLAIIALLMIYSFSALGKLFPGNFVGQIMGLVLFDVAALTWLGVLIYLSKSVGQYSIATIGFGLGLIGTLFLVAAEVMMGGQELTEVPAWAGSSIVWTFIIALIGHVILYYAFKLAAPEISAGIALGYETAQITDEGMRQATEQLIRDRGLLGNMIAPRMITDVKRSLNLPVGDVIELTAQNVDNTSYPLQFPTAPQFVPQNTTSVKRKSPTDLGRRLKAAIAAFSNPGIPVAVPVAQQPATPTHLPQPVPAPTPIPTPHQPAASPNPTPTDPVPVPAVIPPVQQPTVPSEPGKLPFILPSRKAGDTPTNEEPTTSSPT